MLTRIHYVLGISIATVTVCYFSEKIYNIEHSYQKKINQLDNQICNLSNECLLLKKNNDLLLKFIKNNELNIKCDEFIKKEEEKEKKLDNMMVCSMRHGYISIF